MNPYAIEHNLARFPRHEPPLRFADYIAEGRDDYMDEGEIQDAENRYEAAIDRRAEG